MSTVRHPRGWPLLLGAALTLAASAAAAQSPDAKVFRNAELRYSVALPAGCRHEEGPGTIDAVCSADLDAEKSAGVSAAASLVLEVNAQSVPEDAGKTPADLAKDYGEAQFKDELPEAICGEQDKGRVKIANPKQAIEDGLVVYTADIACPEIKFLGLAERDATARFLITPGVRYRLMARALKDDFEKRKEAVDAFFASFRTLPAETKTP